MNKLLVALVFVVGSLCVAGGNGDTCTVAAALPCMETAATCWRSATTCDAQTACITARSKCLDALGCTYDTCKMTHDNFTVVDGCNIYGGCNSASLFTPSLFAAVLVIYTLFM
mmetsp:Transcript_20751/g.34286  ORF Transcript_20751/g.34286 Transcript_20751/m.34286 type:complete len:113 (+) Transcript_20751:115-453(+)